MSPITPEVAQKLEEEAMEKAGVTRQRTGPARIDLNKVTDRLRVASVMLGNAIEAHRRAGNVLDSVREFYMAELEAAVAQGVSPFDAVRQAAGDRLADRLRPKTFNGGSPVGAESAAGADPSTGA